MQQEIHKQKHMHTHTNKTNCILDLPSYKEQTWGTHVPMMFDLRVDPPEKCHMVYPCVMTRNHSQNTWRWYFSVTISRGFRLNHLNGSSDSIGRWENTNTRSQKDLVNVCFTSIKGVWKPEPKISKTNKHKGNFHTISVGLDSWYI